MTAGQGGPVPGAGGGAERPARLVGAQAGVEEFQALTEAHSAAAGARFDQQAFAEAIRVAIARRNVKDQQAAAEAGVAASTITRCVRQDRRPDVDTFVRLCAWAGLPLDEFATKGGGE